MLDWLAEQRIQAANRSGEFDNLPGAHKPLPPDSLDPLIPPHLRVAMRVIHNAGGVPADLLMRKELARVDSLIAAHANGNSDTQDDAPVGALLNQGATLQKLQERRFELLIRLQSGS